jgi:hypothetical protein
MGIFDLLLGAATIERIFSLRVDSTIDFRVLKWVLIIIFIIFIIKDCDL